MGDNLLKCQPRLLFYWEMFAGAHLSNPYRLIAALPEIILNCFMVPADPRSEPSNSVIIKPSFWGKDGGCNSCVCFTWHGFQVSLILIGCKLAIWLQRPALRCLSIYFFGEGSGWGGRAGVMWNANNLDGDGGDQIYSCTLQLREILIDKREQTRI